MPRFGHTWDKDVYNGSNIAGTQPQPQQVYTGQQVQLTGEPSGGTWLIDGSSIACYMPTSTASQNPNCNPTVDLSSNPVDFYWSAPSSGPFNITYTFTYPNGNSLSSTAQFDAIGPNVTTGGLVFGTGLILEGRAGGATFPAPPYAQQYLGCGFKVIGGFGDPCVFFYAKGSTPGNFEWVQILKRYDQTVTTSSGETRTEQVRVVPSLDREFPYPIMHDYGLTYTVDAPLVTLFPNAVDQNVSFEAYMYLFWTPSTPNAIPVSLGYYDWTWHGLALRYATDTPWFNNALLFPTIRPFVATAIYPTWKP